MSARHPPPRPHDAENRAGNYFDGGVTQQFAQPRLADGMPLEQLVDDLVEDARLNARRAPHARRIVHHDDCQDKRDRKKCRTHTFGDANGGCQRADRCRVRRRHPARANEQAQIDAPLADILDDRFGDLGDEPGDENRLEDAIGEKIIHVLCEFQVSESQVSG